MSILPGTHVLRQPAQHRVTLIEGDAETSYIGRTYDNYFVNGIFSRFVAPDSYEKESFPVIGCYLVEELTGNGMPAGKFEILTESEFKEKYGEYSDPGLDYGVCQEGSPYPFKWCPDIVLARQWLTKHRERFSHSYELVSRPVGTNDAWTVVL